MSIKDHVGWTPVISIDYVLTYVSYMGLRKPSSFDGC
jgi:hypothetical protein